MIVSVITSGIPGSSFVTVLVVLFSTFFSSLVSFSTTGVTISESTLGSSTFGVSTFGCSVIFSSTLGVSITGAGVSFSGAYSICPSGNSTSFPLIITSSGNLL